MDDASATPTIAGVPPPLKYPRFHVERVLDGRPRLPGIGTRKYDASDPVPPRGPTMQQGRRTRGREPSARRVPVPAVAERVVSSYGSSCEQK
jgi:hypothetical protein